MQHTAAVAHNYLLEPTRLARSFYCTCQNLPCVSYIISIYNDGYQRHFTHFTNSPLILHTPHEVLTILHLASGPKSIAAMSFLGHSCLLEPTRPARSFHCTC